MLLKLTIVSFIIAQLGSNAAYAAINRYTDTKAGISYPVLSQDARSKSPKEISTLNNAQAAKAARITYTSGFNINKEKIPYLLVWTVPLDSPLTRSVVDSLKDGELVFRLLGIKDWRFNSKILRGSGMGQRNGAIRSELVMQVLKNRYAYVGFFYERDEQLNDWKKIKAGIEPIASFKVDYNLLPQSMTTSALANVGKVLGFLLLIGGLGWVGWYGYQRHQEQQKHAQPIKSTRKRAA